MNPQRGTTLLRTAVVLTAALAGAASVSSKAYAQPWLPDRAYTEGPGIRVGDLELHPGVAVRGGYDTNVFRADGKTRILPDNSGGTVDATQRIRGAGVLAVTPHIHLSTLTAQRQSEGEDRGTSNALPVVTFRGGLSATYFHYFIDNAPRNLEVDSDLRLSILPQRPFGIDANFAYARNVRPFTQNAGNRNAYNADFITPRVRFNFGSRSRVLTGYAGYAPRISIYESSTFNYLNNINHGVEVGSSWRFLPNTAFVYDANLFFQRYQDQNAITTISPVLYSDNTSFQTRLGINGAFTRRLSLRILAGYGLVELEKSANADRLDDHEDVVGEAVLGQRFGPGETSLFELGYRRELLSSALGGWIRMDRGFTSLRSLLGRVFMLSIEAGVGYVTYGRLWGLDRMTGQPIPLGSGGSTDRNDIRVDGAVRGEYRITNWLSLMADVSVTAVLTDFKYAFFYQDRPFSDPAQYLAVMAFGGVRAHY